MNKSNSKYSIANKNGLQVEIINYGAIVSKLFVPDNEGNIQDVILGFDDIEEYKTDDSYQGAIVGRYGNRIAGSKIEIDGVEYKLTANEGNNQLHGGLKGFNKVIWNVEDVTGESVTLSYKSHDGDEGFPGNVKLVVEYELTDSNELRINYTGTTDKKTVLNPTNHCYFNLSGSSKNTILDHLVQIDADYITEVDSEMIPTGKLIDVKGTPFDFKKPVRVGENIDENFNQLQLGCGYDHNFVLNSFNSSVRKVAEVAEPESGRVLEVLTDQPGLQFYSGNHLQNVKKGKGNKPYEKRSGLCMEAQGFPDSPNHSHFPSVLLNPGEEYKQTTIYKFSSR